MLASLRNVAACAAGAACLVLGAAQAETVGHYHIFPTPSYIAKTGRAPHLRAGAMEYFGGSVFESSKVVSVLWGPNVNSTIVATVPDFTTALVNSTYVDQMAQYDTHLKGVNGHKGTKQDIGRGSYLGQIQIKPKHNSSNITDEDIQDELAYQIKKGKLPPQDLNTLYMIYFPDTVTITLDGLTSCVDFGAYHFANHDTKLSKKNIFYAVEPDCDAGINFTTFAASHEFAEATTDNVPTPGSNPDFPQAWNTSDGFEIGDLCSSSGTLTAGSEHWTVTQYYLNSTGACSTGNYTSP